MTALARWYPPRGAVKVGPDPNRGPGSWIARCTCCGWTYPEPQYSSTRGDAEDQKRWHRCPVGTVAAFPQCPTCGATGKGCRWDGFSKSVTDWHHTRIDLYVDATGERP